MTNCFCTIQLEISVSNHSKKANSVDDKLKIIFPENKLRHFMQIVSSGDNLHEMSQPIFWKYKTYKKKNVNLLSAGIFTQHVESHLPRSVCTLISLIKALAVPIVQ